MYRANDTNLGRQVAVKVLPEAFAQDADRLVRFELVYRPGARRSVIWCNDAANESMSAPDKGVGVARRPLQNQTSLSPDESGERHQRADGPCSPATLHVGRAA